MLRVPLVLSLLLLAGATAESGDPAMQALEDEIDRSMSLLRLGDEPRPYFVAYRLDDVEITEVGAAFGSLLRSQHSRNRALSVELRVGTPARDNTNFFSFPQRSSGPARSWNGSVRVPLEDDYRELRRHAWLATDEAYKKALEDLSRKSAALENRRLPLDLPDFTAAEPTDTEEVVAAPPLDGEAARSLVTEISSVFRRAPGIHHSAVRLRRVEPRSRYVNSEGSRFYRSLPLLELAIAATAQAADGTPLADVVGFYGRSLSGLPSLEELQGEARELADRLTSGKVSVTLERYNGPVLFTGEASAQLFHQFFAPATVGWRSPVAEDERLGQRLARLPGSLNDRLGGRVLARSMELIDDPTVTEADGVALFGGYRVDEEGVAASRTTVVDRGILKALLSSRNPSRGVPRSTGNRRAAGALPSNLLLSTSQGASEAKLRDELLTLVAERDLEFGIIVRRLANPLLLSSLIGDDLAAGAPSQEGLEGVVEAVKLYPNGEEVRVRSLRFPALGARSFRDVIAASRRRTVFTAPLRTAGAAITWFSGASFGSLLVGPPVVSVAVPDLLFEELTITAPVGSVPRPPVVAHPHFASK